MTTNPLGPRAIVPGNGSSPAMAGGGKQTKPLDPMRVLREHLGLLIITGILGVMLGVGVWGLLLVVHPVFESVATLEVKEPVDRALDMPTGGLTNTRPEQMQMFMATTAYNIRSDEMLRQVLNQREVTETEWYKSFDNQPDALEAFAEQLAVAPIKDTTLIRIAMRDTHKNGLSKIVNEVTTVFLNKQSRQSSLNQAELRSLIIRERNSYEAGHQQMQKDIQQFIIDNSLPPTVETSEAAVAYQKASELMETLKEQFTAITEYFRALQERQQQGGPATYTPVDLAEAKQNPYVTQREEEMRDLQEALEMNMDKYGPNHKMVKDLGMRILELERGTEKLLEQILREQMQSKLQSARTQIDQINAQVIDVDERMKEQKARMADLTGKFVELESMKLQAEIQARRRDRTQSRLDDMDLLLNRQDSKTVHMALSATPAELVSPDAFIVVPGVTLLLLGCVGGVVFLREVVDQRVKSPADVRLLSDIELLGVLPDASEDPACSDDDGRMGQAVTRDPAGLLAESFRQVRTALLTRMDRRGYKTLLLAGAKPQGGVTTVVGNLATSLAYNGRRVLVIDANFRRPGQHHFFEVEGSRGLVDILRGQATIDDVLVRAIPVPSSESGIDLLPAGHAAAAPPELFEGSTFRNLLADFESRYDLILIDAPPALLTSDSQLLAKQVDAVAFVVRAMSEKRGMIERMMRQMDGQRADVLGLILNGVRSSAGGYFRKNYKEFYEYRKSGDVDRGAKSLEEQTAQV